VVSSKPQAEVAREHGISEDTLQRAAKVADKAPELLLAMRNGKLDANTAAGVADPADPTGGKFGGPVVALIADGKGPTDGRRLSSGGRVEKGPRPGSRPRPYPSSRPT
jgi:hypothetical protein